MAQQPLEQWPLSFPRNPPLVSKLLGSYLLVTLGDQSVQPLKSASIFFLQHTPKM